MTFRDRLWQAPSGREAATQEATAVNAPEGEPNLPLELPEWKAMLRDAKTLCSPLGVFIVMTRLDGEGLVLRKAVHEIGTKKKATMTNGKGKTIEGKRARSLAVDDSIVLYSEPPAPVDEPIEDENTIDKPPKRQTGPPVPVEEPIEDENTIDKPPKRQTRQKVNKKET
ncbi:hypothetical protein EG327_010445 [Venturia inaequalis]|uniref:Uncharacterized protein n=1 Tax=Venturia inaequalis TaxID=5025 RepID=A0A8H3UHP1_VENIN|nr:hypothetical protein EG327_010445 [Venturia inaequalis]